MYTIRNPIGGSWELTMQCNMRCKHCAPACGEKASEELTTEEALKLCDDLKTLKIKWLTLSGGEAVLRSDWDLIAKRLSENGVAVSLFTNGWLINQSLVERAIKAGISSVAVSLDGLKETHDYIRMPGSFDKVINALNILNANGITVQVATTVNKKNLSELPDILNVLIDVKVPYWQLQLGLPIGRMGENKELVGNYNIADSVIDFAHDIAVVKNIRVPTILLSDCIGYYNEKEFQVRTLSMGKNLDSNDDKNYSYNWLGCQGGKIGLGILSNGDVTGCANLRHDTFIEGNVKTRSIVDIWNDPDCFAWSRKMKKEQLEGLCKKCVYGDNCLGGCPNERIYDGGSLFSENKFCSFNYSMKNIHEKISSIEDFETLKNIGKKFMDDEQYQISEIILSRALEINNIDLECNKLYEKILSKVIK